MTKISFDFRLAFALIVNCPMATTCSKLFEFLIGL